MRRINFTTEAGLRKYVIGLSVLAVLTLGLVVTVVVQGSGAKTDKETYKTAKAIGADLEDYIDDKNIIPSRLSTATNMNIPEEITYTKVTSKEYKFCVEYNSATSGSFSTSSAQSKLLNGLSSSSSSYSSSSSSTPSYLYVRESHTKGKNCQTVKPVISSSYYKSYNSSDSSTSKCASLYKSGSYTAYYNCLSKSYDYDSDSI